MRVILLFDVGCLELNVILKNERASSPRFSAEHDVARSQLLNIL